MAKIKEFKYGRGFSTELDGTWHKFYSEISKELDEEDDFEKVKEETMAEVDSLLGEKVTNLFESKKAMDEKTKK